MVWKGWDKKQTQFVGNYAKKEATNKVAGAAEGVGNLFKRVGNFVADGASSCKKTKPVTR